MTAPRQPAKRTRLADVAEAAGVSKSTVSRVLNGADFGVAASTRERIHGLAQELNYQPHAGARSLTGGGPQTFAMLVPSPLSMTYTRLFAAAVEQGMENDVAILVLEDKNPDESTKLLRRLIATGRINGVIAVSASPGHPVIEMLESHGLPYCYVMRAVPHSNRNFTLDEATSSKAAIDHLVDLGHVRIGHTAGPSHLDSAQRRADGFKEACRARGVDYQGVEHGDFSEAGGYAATKRLLTTRGGITAIYSSMIAQAVGAIHAAHEEHIAIPDQLSIVTYDDMPLCDYLVPPLTSVKISVELLGRRAIDSLLEQAAGAEPQNMTLPSEPVVITRESTAPPATDQV